MYGLPQPITPASIANARLESQYAYSKGRAVNAGLVAGGLGATGLVLLAARSTAVGVLLLLAGAGMGVVAGLNWNVAQRRAREIETAIPLRG